MGHLKMAGPGFLNDVTAWWPGFVPKKITNKQEPKQQKSTATINCLYCDTTFPQFDDLIKHSIENHPYHCYYCKTTFVLFEEVIKHSMENHG
jgi:PP-loop superfamily ATP-utilizing enzyme